LLEERLQAADLCVGIGLLHGAHVGVVLSRILDFLLLLGLGGRLAGLSLARRWSLLGRWLLGRRLLGSGRLRLRLR
jgi:hypothetical protein